MPPVAENDVFIKSPSGAGAGVRSDFPILSRTFGGRPLIYLDSAAVVKLVHAEPESAALRVWLDERAENQWISSVLTEIESFRALARYAPEAASRLPAVLDQMNLIDLDQHIRMLARAVTPTVRSLDAIHLGTALRSRSSLISFVTYDRRLLDAAQAAALPIDSPT